MTFTCRDKGTEPPSVSIQLSVEDVGVTEAWLSVKVMNTQALMKLVLKRDAKTISIISSPIHDTVLVADSLYPPKNIYV